MSQKPTRAPVGVIPTEIATSPNHTPPQSSDVPDSVGVPKPGRPTLSRQQFLAGGLDTATEQPGVSRSFNNLEQLLQQPQNGEHQHTLTPNEPAVNCLPKDGQVCMNADTSPELTPEPAPAPQPEAAPAPEQKKARKGFLSSAWTGVLDGANGAVAKAREQLSGTKAGARKRFLSILERGERYRKAVSESSLAKSAVQIVEDGARDLGVFCAKVGIWTVEVIATGWIFISCGAWRVTVMCADALTFLGCCGAAAIVEAALSGKELVQNIHAWATGKGKTVQETGTEADTQVAFA
jgi:hypothetical protein